VRNSLPTTAPSDDGDAERGHTQRHDQADLPAADVRSHRAGTLRRGVTPGVDPHRRVNAADAGENNFSIQVATCPARRRARL
jgi:hypothetical protein